MSKQGKKFKVGLIRVLTCEDTEVLYSRSAGRNTQAGAL